MRIGIFGGSFNPPHNTHLQIAKYLLDNDYVDRIIYVPAGINYEYKNNLVANKHRFNMLKLMIDDERIDVSDFEFSDKVTYTYQTLDHFQNTYVDDEIFFICGADNLDYIDTWNNAEELLSKYPIIVFKRGDYVIKDLSKFNARVFTANMDLSDTSSSKIRESIKNGQYDIPDLSITVLDYIRENNLYR